MLALPITPSSALACAPDDGSDADEICGPSATVLRPPGAPPFEAFWVATHLGTRLWPTASSVQGDVGRVGPGRLFRVDAPQRGYRLLVWDPRANQHVYIGSEAVGPARFPVLVGVRRRRQMDGRDVDAATEHQGDAGRRAQDAVTL